MAREGNRTSRQSHHPRLANAWRTLLHHHGNAHDISGIGAMSHDDEVSAYVYIQKWGRKWIRFGVRAIPEDRRNDAVDEAIAETYVELIALGDDQDDSVIVEAYKKHIDTSRQRLKRHDQRHPALFAPEDVHDSQIGASPEEIAQARCFMSHLDPLLRCAINKLGDINHDIIVTHYKLWLPLRRPSHPTTRTRQSLSEARLILNRTLDDLVVEKATTSREELNGLEAVHQLLHNDGIDASAFDARAVAPSFDRLFRRSFRAIGDVANDLLIAAYKLPGLKVRGVVLDFPTEEAKDVALRHARVTLSLVLEDLLVKRIRHLRGRASTLDAVVSILRNEHTSTIEVFQVLRHFVEAAA